MKLPDFTYFTPLNELRRKIGAQNLGDFTPPTSNPQLLTIDEIKRLATSGIDIPLNEVRVLDDGTLAYKDSRIVLYIRDVTQYQNRQLEEYKYPRFHVSNCKKLQDMRSNNRFERYVVATRDDGVFVLNIISGNQEQKPRNENLKICQFCLGKLNWQGFDYRLSSSQKKQMVAVFSLKDFFSKYHKSLITEKPKHTQVTSPINKYPKEWNEISNRRKKECLYKCELCCLDLSNQQNFLQCHHKNGLKYDSSSNNLLVLCYGCHVEEPMHGHMKLLPEYQEFIRLFGVQWQLLRRDKIL